MSDERAPKEMTIPEVRERLYELADAHRLPELRRLADQLWRRKPWRRPVRPRSVAMTPEIAASVRRYVAAHPDVPEDRVGDVFGINQGRVSEALHGHRGG